MVEIVGHGRVVNGVRGPNTRSPPMHGTDGGAEAIDLGYVDRYRGPSRQGVCIVKE